MGSAVTYFLTSHVERTFYRHEAELIREFLGAPEDTVECPTEAQRELFGELTVIDYVFARDRIFAHINLNDDELALYNRIESELEEKLVRPDLVIYLQGSSDVLFDRILNRGRAMERGISRDYLDTLNNAFNHFFFNYSATPLLVVNTDAMDFVNKDEHFQDLVARIAEPVKGTELYAPSWEV